MKKLLIATDSFLPRWDGIARFLIEIVPKLKESYDITIVAPDFKGDFDPDLGVETIRVPLSFIQAGDYSFARHKRRVMKRLVSESDIVFTQTIGPVGWLAIHFASKMNKPVASFVHSIEWELVSWSISRPYMHRFISNLVKVFCRWIYSKSDLLVLPSKEAGKLLRKENIKTEQSVVYLGVDMNKFRPAEDKAAMKERLGFNPDDIVVGFHGRIGREKGVPLLLDTFERVYKDNPRSRLLIVGCGVSEIEDRMKNMKRTKHVRYSHDITMYLQAMDIYVLPSYTETTSLSTLEAMSCGCAVIASKVGLVKRYIRDKYNGLLFNPGNETVLKIKLNSLLNNPELVTSLGSKARETVIDKFEWTRTVDGVQKSLRSIDDE